MNALSVTLQKATLDIATAKKEANAVILMIRNERKADFFQLLWDKAVSDQKRVEAKLEGTTYLLQQAQVPRKQAENFFSPLQFFLEELY